MQLSPRLSKIASLIKPCDVVADVGTDHGYIPLYCLKNGIAKKVIATDVNAMPLKRAETNIKNEGYSDHADFRLCNGLLGLSEGEADVIVIAGMGGLLICDILEKGKGIITDSTQLHIQPMIAPFEVRTYLYSNGFDITNEYVIREEDKFYNIMAVQKGSAVPNDELLYIGRNLFANSPDVIGAYLDYKISVCEKIINGHKKSKNPDIAQIEKYSHELSVYINTKKELSK